MSKDGISSIMKRRVKESFPVDSESREQVRSDALEYLKALREVWNNVSTTLNQTLLIMLALAAIFELLKTGQAKQFSIAGFSFGDTTIIQTFLPVLVAYLNFEVILLATRFDEISDIHSLVMAVAFPNIEGADLEIALIPPSRALLAAGGFVSESNMTKSEQLIHRLRITMIILAFLLPIAFEIHAFYVLFVNLGFRNLLTWIALAVSGVLVMASTSCVLMQGAEADYEA